MKPFCLGLVNYDNIRHWVGASATRTTDGLRIHANRPGHPAALLTNMRILDIPQSEKCGTFVSVRTRYGQIRRRRGVIRKSPTPAQQRIRSIFAFVVALWRSLNEQQRAAWGSGGKDTSSQSKLLQSGKLPGYVLFMKLNTTLAYQGLPPALVPTERPTFSRNEVGNLVITNTAGEIDLKLSVPTAPTAIVLVLGTAPRSAGVSFANHFTILGRLPAPEAGYSNIRKLYVDRYGEPSPGTRVFIRTRQLVNGWEDDPQQTAALVPKP
jgi:hypothetical protein